MNKTVLVTGATAGIGESTAEYFARNNWNVIVCGRRKERLFKLNQRLEKDDVKILPLAFDISKRNEVDSALKSIPDEFKKIDLLINNAGGAHGLDPFQNASIDDWDAMIGSNLQGLLYISKPISNWMIENGKGHIINVSSIAGTQVYPNGNVYNAVKHACDALTKAMRIDLLGTGVKVSSISPGLVETEFSMVRFKGDKEKADAVYQGYTPLSGEDLAESIYWMATRPAHVNIADIVIYPSDQASARDVNKV